jgi:hypothetical protein
MEVCPSGYEKSPFFAFLFLQHLPTELRIMLGEDNVDDLNWLSVSRRTCSGPYTIISSMVVWFLSALLLRHRLLLWQF